MDPPPTRSPSSNFHLYLWLGLMVLALAGLYAVAAALVPFLLAVVLAYMGKPVVDLLTSKWALGRGLAAALVLALLTLALLLIPLLLLPLVAAQLGEVVLMLPNAWARAWAWLGAWIPDLTAQPSQQGIREIASQLNLGGASLAKMGSVLGFLSKQFNSFLNLLAILAITPLVTFFLLRDWPTLLGTAHNHLPLQLRPVVVDVATISDRVLGEFLRGQVSVMLVMAFTYSILLGLAGTPFAIAIGTVTGLLSFIPFVGFSLGLVLAVLATFLNFESWLGLGWTLAAMLVGQAIEGFWVTPQIIGNRIGLGPVAVLFTLAVMGTAFGFAGVLLALPVAAVALALWQHFLPPQPAASDDAV